MLRPLYSGKRGVASPELEAMLDADRHALSASVYHSALGIKERELVNLTNYLNNLGTQVS